MSVVIQTEKNNTETGYVINFFVAGYPSKAYFDPKKDFEKQFNDKIKMCEQVVRHPKANTLVIAKNKLMINIYKDILKRVRDDIYILN